jgi:hypothetical protein
VDFCANLRFCILIKYAQKRLELPHHPNTRRMFKSPLIQTLRLLHQEELEMLHFFVNSPLFNEMNRFRDTIALFEYLKPFFPAFTQEALKKETVSIALFPERKNPKNELEKAMSHLMRVVRQFITFQQFAVKGRNKIRNTNKDDLGLDPVSLLNGARQQLALMRFYSERLHQKPKELNQVKEEDAHTETDNFFLNIYEKQKKDFTELVDFTCFENYEFNDFQYFNYLLEQEKALFDSLKQRREGNRTLLLAMESLDKFYLLSKLNILCHLSHQIKMGIPFSKDLDEKKRYDTNRTLTLEMVNHLKAEEYLQIPAVVFYTTLLECLNNDDVDLADKAADTFFELLEEGPKYLPESQINDFKVILRSYWARRYRQTRNKFFSQRIFDMQLDQIRKLKENESIPVSQMHNLVVNALKLQKTTIAEQLIKQFDGRVNGASPPNLFNDIWKSLIRFGQKNYIESAANLPHYYSYGEVDDIVFYSVAATLDVKIRYELNTLDEEQHFNMMRATSKRIKSDKTLPSEARKERERFFPAATKLFKIKTKSRLNRKKYPEEVAEIKTVILSAPVVDQEWLLEKCDELVANF